MSISDSAEISRPLKRRPAARHLDVRTAGMSACALLTALTMAACGTSGTAGSGQSSGSPTAGSAGTVSVPQSDGGYPNLSGPDKKATGKPLVFGMISMSLSSKANFSEGTDAAKVAADYVNTKLGGINGRPIKIIVCDTDGAPATSAACANKLVQQKPVAFFGAPDPSTSASLPLIAKAGLAYIGGVGFGGPESSQSNSFQFVGGSTTVFSAMGEFAVKNLHAKKVALTQPTGAATAAIAANLVAGAARQAGLAKSDVKIVPLDPTAADVTPQVSAMNAFGPDAMVGINPGTQCVSLAQAKQSLGVTAAFFLPSGCSDPAQMKQMGAAANGIYMPFEVQVPGDNGADVKLFKAAMAKSAPKARMNEFTAAGFQAVINTYAVLSKGKASLTPPAVISAFEKAKDVHNFMGPDFTCDHSMKAYPALCNPKQMMFQYNNGTWTPVSNFFTPADVTTTQTNG